MDEHKLEQKRKEKGVAGICFFFSFFIVREREAGKGRGLGITSTSPLSQHEVADRRES